MLRRLILAFALIFASQAIGAPQEVRLADGRSYRIDLPVAAQGAPMILALHGGGGNPDQFARNSGLSQPALQQGYAVIFPAGSGRGRLNMLTWNAGACCAYAALAKIDDMGFLDQVIADAARRFGLDAGRVYLTGMSNGSMMAERYAAGRGGRVKAVAGVSGPLDSRFSVRQAVPMLHIHGTADDHVPYAGGRGESSVTKSVTFASVDSAIAAFVDAAGVSPIPAETIVDPADDGMRVVRHDWRRSDGTVVVRLLTVEGGGHVWPGGRRAERGGGSRDIDANAELLAFFALHP